MIVVCRSRRHFAVVRDSRRRAVAQGVGGRAAFLPDASGLTRSLRRLLQVRRNSRAAARNISGEVITPVRSNHARRTRIRSRARRAASRDRGRGGIAASDARRSDDAERGLLRIWAAAMFYPERNFVAIC